MTLYIFQPRELKNQETIAREQRLDKEVRTSIHAYLCACKDEQVREIARSRLRESTLSDVTQSDSAESTCSETATCSTGSDTSDVSMESVIPGRPHLNTTVCANQDVMGISALDLFEKFVRQRLYLPLLPNINLNFSKQK